MKKEKKGENTSDIIVTCFSIVCLIAFISFPFVYDSWDEIMEWWNKVDIEKITVEGADGKEYESYQEACRAGDFDAAWSYVEKLENTAMTKLDKYDRYYREYVDAYINARDFVFNSEVQVLISMKNDDASDRVLYLLNSLQMKGTELPEGYVGEDACMEIVDGACRTRDFAWYCESVNSFNKKCIQTMELSISSGNKYLADKVLNMVKKTPISEKKGYHEYEVRYSNKDKEKIKKLYDEAVKSGAFN